MKVEFVCVLGAAVVAFLANVANAAANASDPFDDCIIAGPPREEACFNKPTNKMKNELNRCKCEIYNKTGLMQPREEQGKGKKKSKCKIAIPEELKPVLTPALLPLLMFPISFAVKMCFWKRMGLTDGKTVLYGNFKNFVDMFETDDKLRTRLKEKIDECINDPTEKKPVDISAIPLMSDILAKFMPVKEFIKCNCIGSAFGEVCKDVTSYDMVKLASKFTELSKPVDSLFGNGSAPDFVKAAPDIVKAALPVPEVASNATGAVVDKATKVVNSSVGGLTAGRRK